MKTLKMNPADVLFDMNMALLDACRAGDLTTVKRLSKTGFIDLNRKTCDFGYTPLWWACRFEHQKIVRYLIEEEKVRISLDEIIYLVKSTTYVKVFYGLDILVKYSLMPRSTRNIIRTLLFITESQCDTPEISLLKATIGDIFPIILETIMHNAFRELCYP